MKFIKNYKGERFLKSYKKDKNTNYTVALAGNPNVGKSTVFNALTGLKQHTGNWPGKTVANAEGIYGYRGEAYKVVDLPGTYSLLSNSEEEEIARDFICFNNYDVIVVVADATSLERNLNLFFQILEMTDKVILCVNLIDEAEKNGIDVDIKKLQDELGVRVVKTSARNKVGLDKLQNAIMQVSKCKNKNPINIKYPDEIEEGKRRISDVLNIDLDEKKKSWVALRLLEGNKAICNSLVSNYKIKNNILEEVKNIKNQVVNKLNNEEIGDKIVEKLVKTSEEINEKVIKSKKLYGERDAKIDKIITSKMFGIPLMVLVLLVTLWITITLANYPSQALSNLFALGEEKLRVIFTGLNAPSFISGILIDGIYITLAWVVSVMLPPMAIFFPIFTLLEDLGYLPRIAFNLDKSFKRCCSCGKQALTMCMGLGCNAAGVIGCRIINSPRERLIAIITNNFMPCNGRFPMIITIATIFVGGLFSGKGGNLFSALAVTMVIILGIFITFMVSKFLSKTFLKGVPSSLVLELPPYRKPQVGKVIVRSIFDRTLYVLGRAVIVAAPAGIVIWIFANIPFAGGTLLSVCADFLNPLGNLIGLDGYILMAFILGIPANEIVMPIIIMSYLRANTMLELDSLIQLKELLVSNGWTILTAINVMLLTLMHYPCATTLLTIKKETNSMKWTFLSFIIPTVLGLLTCFVTAQVYRIFV